MNKLAAEMDVVLGAVDGAAKLLHDFEARRAGIVQSSKSGGELVTAADCTLNKHLVDAIHDAFPDDAICAEEGSPWDDAGARRRWFIDPIDGTRSFIAGKPGYSIMLGLVVDGVPRLGVIYDPAGGSTLIAETGQGVHEVSGGIHTRLEPAEPEKQLAWSPFSKLEAAGPLAVALDLSGIRMFESVGMRAAALARGQAAVFASGPDSPKLWDSAPASVVIHEIGGRYTDFDMCELNYATEDHTHRRGAVASVGLDHVEVVAAVRKILGCGAKR